jgi:hypothetical protein
MQIDDVSIAIFLDILHSFPKFERILVLMMKRANGVEIGEIHFYNTFGSNMLLTLKIMNFENEFPITVIHFYVVKNINA